MKKLLISLLSIFAFVTFLSLVSATIDLTLSDSPTTLTEFQNSTSFKINAGTSVNFSLQTPPFKILDLEDNAVTLAVTNTTPLNNVMSATFSVNVVTIFNDFNLGKYSIDLLVYAENISDSNDNKTITVPIEFENTPCEFQNLGNNLNIKTIKNSDLSIISGFGEDNKWFPLDEIEVEIDIENDGTEEDIDNIVVEWGLYNLETGEWVIDDEENDFNLKDGDEETLFIKFKLDDVDEFENNGKYEFFVWATGEDDEFDGDGTCISTSRDIEMQIENNFVVLDNIEYPETAQCGANVQITADVWNIGEDDQDDVFVLLENSELGISEQVFIGDIDKFDNAGTPLSFNFKVPSDAEEKLYSISLTVYDEDNDIYENDFDDKSRFITYLKVAGNCAVSEPVSISANLESGGKAGDELVILVIVTNIGTETADYRINIAEYSDWASSVNANPETFTLDAGISEESILRFDVQSDVSGEKSFNIEVFSGNKLVATQPVSVTIEESGFSRLTGGLISEDNWYIWGLGLFNVILILVIIFVAVRIARKRE